MLNEKSSEDNLCYGAIALEWGIIQIDEAERAWQAEAARKDAIQVDAFTLDEYQKREAIVENKLEHSLRETVKNKCIAIDYFSGRNPTR